MDICITYSTLASLASAKLNKDTKHVLGNQLHLDSGENHVNAVFFLMNSCFDVISNCVFSLWLGNLQVSNERDSSRQLF